MRHDNDQWIDQRIRWRAGKHGLPTHQTFLFPNLPDTHRAMLISIAEDHGVGMPVLAFIDGSRWTLVGTQRIVSCHDDEMVICDLTAISDVDIDEDYRTDANPSESNYLKIFKKEEHEPAMIWAPRGSECFALWNILLMLSKLKSCVEADQYE